MSLLQSDAASKGIDRVDYPTSDGRPMGETDLHRDEMFEAIETLKTFFKGQRVYVTGNLLLFYEEGNRRRHVSPDVMVVKSVEHRQRENYLLWAEGKAPDVVIEVTSKSTKNEDLVEKHQLYRDKIRVAEYFLFDPRSEYLSPALQGYRLSQGKLTPIAAVDSRLPSQELGLHLEKVETSLRFYDPITRRWLPTIHEAQAEAEALLRKEEAALRSETEARRKAEAEVERLRREIEKLRGSGADEQRS